MWARHVCFRRRSDLQKFAARYPGAFGAQFLTQVLEKASKGAPRRSSDFYKVDQGTLKELRDQREVLVLSRLLAELNHNRMAQAVDVIALRLREILMAKASGGSWEKAAVVSPLPSGSAGAASIPDGAFTLP